MRKFTEPFVLALIPARGGSKGIPHKNVRPLAGKPLIQYTCECARNSRTVCRTIVSTDCQQIADVALAADVEVPFLRPGELAADDTPSLDVVMHAVSWLKYQRQQVPDIIVLLQPTAPLRKPHHVDEAVQKLMTSDADSIVSVCRVPSHYHPQWQLTIEDGGLRTLAGESLAGLPSRRQLLSPTHVRNGAIYAVRRQSLDSTGSLYGRTCLAYEMPSQLSVNIDTPADWETAEAVLGGNEDRHEAA